MKQQKKVAIVILGILLLIVAVACCFLFLGKADSDNQLEFTVSDVPYGEKIGSPVFIKEPFGNAPISYSYEGINGTVYKETSKKPKQIGEYQVTGTTWKWNGYKSVSYSTTFKITGETLEYSFPIAATICVGEKLADARLEQHSGEGKWKFTNPRSVFEAAGTERVELVFTPANSRYAAIKKDITLLVKKHKITELNVTWPTAGEVTYGSQLSDSQLIGGSGNGIFRWATPETYPTVENSGYRVEFVPSDADLYDYGDFELTNNIAITVHKAVAPTEIVFPTTGPISYGQTLEDAYLGGDYTAYGGSFEWKQPNFVPNVGDNSFTMVFYKDLSNYNYEDTTPTIEQEVAIRVNKSPCPPPEDLQTVFFVRAGSVSQVKTILESYENYYVVADTLPNRPGKSVVSMKYNSDRQNYGDYDFEAIVLWETSAGFQSTANAVTRSSVITKASAPTVGANGTMFNENDSLHLVGTADNSGWIYFFWRTNNKAIVESNEINLNMRLYVRNNGNSSPYWRWNTLSNTLGQATFSPGVTYWNLTEMFNTEMTGYWSLHNGQLYADGSGHRSLGVGDDGGVICETAGPNESVNGATQYWIIGFAINVGAGQDYDLEMCLVGSGECAEVLPQTAGDFYVYGETAEDAIAALVAKYPCTVETEASELVIGKNLITVKKDGRQQLLNLCWEKEGAAQSVLGFVSDASTLTGSTFSKVEKVKYKSSFAENDTVNVTGKAGGDGFVYFYWKTDQMAICNNATLDMDMRLYIKSNSSAVGWQFDTVAGNPRTHVRARRLTAVDLLASYESNLCGYWMLNNQKLSADGKEMIGLGVGNHTGIVNMTANGLGPNENITEDGKQFWVVGFRIYVGANQSYDLDLCLAGSGTKAEPDRITSYTVEADTMEKAIAAFENANPGYTVAEGTELNIGINTVEVSNFYTTYPMTIIWVEVAEYYATEDTAEAAIEAFEKTYQGYDIAVETIVAGKNMIPVTTGELTYDLAFYWEKADSLQSVSNVVSDAEILTGSTLGKIESISNKTTFIENDTINIKGTADSTGFVYFYWKTNQMAACNNATLDMDMRLYVQNNGGMAEWQKDTASGAPRIPFAEGKMTVVDMLSAFQDNMCGYWMLVNQKFSAEGKEMIGLGVGNHTGVVNMTANGLGPNENVTEDGKQFWVVGFRIYVGANQAYDLDLCLAGSGTEAEPDCVTSYTVAADTMEAAIAAFENANPGYTVAEDVELHAGVNTVEVSNFYTTYPMTIIWVEVAEYYATEDTAEAAIATFEATYPNYKIATETISLGKNVVPATVGDITYDLVFYWEKADSLQSVSNVVSDAEILTGSTLSKIESISNKTTFIENDTISIKGTADSTGFVYFYWKTNQMAICNNFDPVVNMRLYVQNNGGMAEWQKDTASGAPRIPFAEGKMTVVDMGSAFLDNMCGYWMLANQQFSATGNGMFGLGVGNGNEIVVTRGPNESVTEDGSQYWIIGFRIYVGANQNYDLDFCLVGTGEKVSNS